MNDTSAGPSDAALSLSGEEQAIVDAVRTLLSAAIAEAGGVLPFDRFMEIALYAPQVGYYNNPRCVFGPAGDFVTAPEVSPVFSQCLAHQLAECLAAVPGGEVLELGAGSGRMAADMLCELQRLDALPTHYRILELSPTLRALQQETLRKCVPQLCDRVSWLDRLPEAGFRGVVVGNEVLDAMPVHRFRRAAGEWRESVVSEQGGELVESWSALRSDALGVALDRLWPHADLVDDGYCSEVNLRLSPWLQSLAETVASGYLLLVDYGYSQREYYHPERSDGTLICHFRHQAGDDPLLLPGLQDITANVDFTALAKSATACGFALAGYTTQAHFLIDNDLDTLLMDAGQDDPAARIDLMQGVKTLVLPAQMGERFKVMAFAREAPPELRGFRSRDLRDRL